MYEYKKMDSAPMDGSVVMVLCGAKWPVAAYWHSKGMKSVQDGHWRTAITDKEITPGPQWWTSLPAQAPTDYLQSLEHLPFVLQGGVWPDRFSDSAQEEMIEKMKEETSGPLTDKPIPSPPAPPVEGTRVTGDPNLSADHTPREKDDYSYKKEPVKKQDPVYIRPKDEEEEKTTGKQSKTGKGSYKR